jgi:hypothetical protein
VATNTSSVPRNAIGEARGAACFVCDLIDDLQATGEHGAWRLLAGLRHAGWACDELEELVCRERLDLATTSRLPILSSTTAADISGIRTSGGHR